MNEIRDTVRAVYEQGSPEVNLVASMFSCLFQDMNIWVYGHNIDMGSTIETKMLKHI